VRGGGRVSSAELGGAELAQRLSLDAARDVTPSLTNAEWIHPRVLRGLAPGEIRTLHARLKHPAAGPLQVTLTSVGDDAAAHSTTAAPVVLTVPVRAGEPLLIERSVAGGEIRRMSAEL